MKGGGGSFSTSHSLSVPVPAKRRWKRPAIAVLGLVVLSMLVPLVFLLGLHNGFHSIAGYVAEQRNSAPVRVYDQHDSADSRNHFEAQRSEIKDHLVRSSAPPFSKSFWDNSLKETMNKTDGIFRPTELPRQVQKNPESLVKHGTIESFKGVDESEMMCELKFGSYCLWRRAHKEKVDDTVVKQMKDLLFVARAYYPSIMKLPSYDKLSQELRQNIQDFERLFSEATSDNDLPPQYDKKLTRMKDVIAKAQSCPIDCNNVDKKFRQLVDLTEDEANFHSRQSILLHQLAVETMPKSLHCLAMRLTVDYFRSEYDIEQILDEKFEDPNLNHYIIFSRNILAASVVINSTVFHAKESGKHVFHLLVDRDNYFAMKMWFFKNKYGEAAVQVLNIEDFDIYDHQEGIPLHLSLPEEFRVSFRRIDNSSSTQIRTEYLSTFSHAHYFLPKIFKTLGKVIVLDDDIVVQRDLSALWNLEMDGKVNGALQFCQVKLFHLEHYLPRSISYENSCAWTSGINIIDLSRWRSHNLTETYLKLVHEMSRVEGLSETTTLSAGLLTFRGLVYDLDSSWMLSGLSRDYGIDMKDVENAAVLHFDGSMKPWLELGIPKYRSRWRKFLNKESPYLNDCNLNQ